MNRHAHDALATSAKQHASLAFAAQNHEGLELDGHYTITCTAPADKDLHRLLAIADAIAVAERRQDWIARYALRKGLQAIPQHVVWEAQVPNLVVTTGKNLILDQGLATGETLSAITSVTIATVAGGAADPAPEDVFNDVGDWLISAGSLVLVPVKDGVPNASYLIEVVAQTSTAKKVLALTATLPVREGA